MVLMTVAVIVGACSSGGTATTAPTAATSAEASASGSTEPSASAGGSPASADCAGTGAQGGADLQIPDVEAGKFNVAMVLIGPHDDGGWSQAHYEGLQYMCQNVPDTHVAYIELVPEGVDSEQVFRSLARKGFNFIIGTSFGYMDPMATVAEEFPDITFLHLTGYKSNGKNFGNFFGAMEDFKYLAGMSVGEATTPWFTKNLAGGDVDTFVSCGRWLGAPREDGAMVPQQPGRGNACHPGRGGVTPEGHDGAAYHPGHVAGPRYRQYEHHRWAAAKRRLDRDAARSDSAARDRR